MCPGPHLGSRRAIGSRPRRSGCSSGRSGSARRTNPRAPTGSRGSPRRRSTAPARRPASRGRAPSCIHRPCQQRRHLVYQLPARSPVDRGACHENRIVFARERTDLGPRRPQDPACAVALHRTADPLARDRGDLPRPRGEEYHDATSSYRAFAVEDARDLARTHDARPFLQVKRRVAPGPCGGATRGSNDRPACACGGGTRAPSLGGGCSVGTSVCPWP